MSSASLHRLRAWPGWQQRRPPRGLAGAAFWLAVWLLVFTLLRYLPGELSIMAAVLQVLTAVALAVTAIPMLWRLVRQRMLWSLRNKLIVTYLLIGLAPVILFVTLVTISTYIAAGQFAIHLADTRVEAELDNMATGNAVRTARVVHIIDDTPPATSHATPPGTVPPSMAARIGEIGLTERAAAKAQRNRLNIRVEAFLDGAPVPEPGADRSPATHLGLPVWAVALPNGVFRGIVLDGDDLYLVSVRQQRLSDGRLFTMLDSLPVDNTFIQLVAEGLGRVRYFTQRTVSADSASLDSPANTPRPRRFVSISGGEEPQPLSLADIRVRFLSTSTVTDWATGTPANVPIEVLSRPSLLYLQLFGGSLSGVVTSAIRIGLIGLTLLFALIEALALLMAVRLTRTVTASVGDLYNATQRIDRGELGHRILVERDDQMAELNRSFNSMTGSLQRLLREQQEKERLQNELSIAQEVQANLFPQRASNLPTLELHGICRPARAVSGDYYDFLPLEDSTPGQPTGVGIALGDISGKGISAALLMATLHSAVRAYRLASEELVLDDMSITNGHAARGTRGDRPVELFESPGRILALLNRHLYRSTQPEKYATLFLAHYNAATACLTYSNAGQLPPLVLRTDGSVKRLDCGGTVVGLLDGMSYQQESLPLGPGDIMVAYSDGVTEPENDFGDFGEERMLEVVWRYRHEPLPVISAQLMQALDAWIGAEEQPDDITLVLARQL